MFETGKSAKFCSFASIGLKTAGGAFGLGFVEDFFAETNGFGSNLDEFITSNIFQSIFQPNGFRGIEMSANAFTLGTIIGQLFFFANINANIFRAGILADDLAFIDGNTRANKENSPVLNI